jgi:hypothetical protein
MQLMVLRKIFFTLLLLFLPVPAAAEVVVSFYSHDFGSSFPHAFVTVKGKLDRGGDPIDTSYGFTAKSLTPAILMGPVVGMVETLKPQYVQSSDRQFSLKISDGQYDAMMVIVAKWRNQPGKSYSLNSHNCIHFTGEIAQILAMKVVFDRKLIKKPRSFLLSLIALNPWVKGGATGG